MSISQINLGSFYTNSSGQSVSNGLSSGLNTQSLIQALTAGQSSQITALQDKVTVNNSKASALSTLSSLLTNLQNAANILSNPSNPDTTNNIWAVRTTNITSNTTQAASNYISATVESGTAPGTYTISDITQLAQSTIQESGTFASVTAAVVTSGNVTGEFSAGSLTIENPNGTTSATVTLNAGDTLSDVASDFNAVSSTTGIKANVVQTSEGIYALTFTSTATGADTVFDLGSSATVTSGQSLISNVSFSNVQAGKDAQFEFNNIAIDRPTNTISDLVSGVTFNLLQNTNTDPQASFSVQITPDVSSIDAGINAFAQAYNNFVAFYTQQTALNTSGTPASSAVLYSDTTLRNIYNSLSTEVASIVTGLGTSAPNSLANLGITLAQPASSTSSAISPSILSVDDSSLESSLESNFNAVANVFGYNLTSSSPDLILYQSSNSQTVQNFSVSILDTGSVDGTPIAIATYASTTGATITVTFNATTLSTGGVSLTGPSDSALAGLHLLYVNDTTMSGITVSTTQGVASTVSNELTAALQSNTGQIAIDQNAISTSTTTIQQQITTETSQETAYREQLLQKYSQLESAINSSNSIIDLLNANANAGSSG